MERRHLEREVVEKNGQIPDTNGGWRNAGGGRDCKMPPKLRSNASTVASAPDLLDQVKVRPQLHQDSQLIPDLPRLGAGGKEGRGSSSRLS